MIDLTNIMEKVLNDMSIEEIEKMHSKGREILINDGKIVGTEKISTTTTTEQ